MDFENDPARMAAVNLAVTKVQPGMTIGFGSGRAVFALVREIGRRGVTHITAVVASPATAEYARAAGMTIADVDGIDSVPLTFDGADEIDHEFRMIKGGGLALLHEKILAAASEHVVILVEEPKLVARLGVTHRLPVEIIRFGWNKTMERVRAFVDDATLRRDESGQQLVTSEGNYLLDINIPDVDLANLGRNLKSTLGVVEHGLFLDQADEVIVGAADGSALFLQREIG